MKEVTAYRCSHCGKVYLKEYSCRKHEEKTCPLNPDIRPLCYSCEHYEPSFEDSEKEYIRYVYYTGSYVNTEYSDVKLFSPNRCNHSNCKRKLYNNIKLSDEMRKGLAESGYYPMPTPLSGGCRVYKAIPNHPYAQNINSDNK